MMHPDITSDQMALAAVMAAGVRKLEHTGWLGPKFRSPKVAHSASIVGAVAVMGLLHLLMQWDLDLDFAWESARQVVFQWFGREVLKSGQGA